MPQNENQDQPLLRNQERPLTKRDLLEVSANGFTVVQGVGSLLAGLAALLMGLQVQPTPSAQPASHIQPTSPTQIQPSSSAQPASHIPPTSPKIEIQIDQSLGSEPIIKVKQVEYKISQLTVSEENETLSKAREAITELRKLISEKKNELEQGQAQLISREDTLKLNSDQLQCKAELENSIRQLQDEIEKLDNIQQRIEASQEAIEWLNPDTQRQTLYTIAKEAGDEALKAHLTAHPEQKSDWETPEATRNKDRFYYNIQNFLELIHTCLLACRPNIIDTVLNEQQFHRVPLPATAYVSAFEFIRDYKVNEAVSDRAATEVSAYLNYIIEKSDSLSQQSG